MRVKPIPAGLRGFVESEGEQIYFESWGAGETVVLCHGLGGNHAIWYQQVPVLAARYRVVTWDQRGFGRSTHLTDSFGPVPAVGDLVRVLDHLDVERVHLIGQSMGGWVALGFAVAHPERVTSLVLADSTGGIFTSTIRQSLLDYGQVMAAGPSPDRLPLGHHPAIGEQLAEENLAQAFLYTQIGGMATPPPAPAIAGLLMTTDHTDRLDRLRAPTLFIVGENDPMMPPRIVKEAAGLIPGSEVRVIENSGHSPYFERPGIWNDLVLEFLRRC